MESWHSSPRNGTRSQRLIAFLSQRELAGEEVQGEGRETYSKVFLGKLLEYNNASAI
jgi:hypothetical protein